MSVKEILMQMEGKLQLAVGFVKGGAIFQAGNNVMTDDDGKANKDGIRVPIMHIAYMDYNGEIQNLILSFEDQKIFTDFIAATSTLAVQGSALFLNNALKPQDDSPPLN